MVSLCRKATFSFESDWLGDNLYRVLTRSRDLDVPLLLELDGFRVAFLECFGQRRDQVFQLMSILLR